MPGVPGEENLDDNIDQTKGPVAEQSFDLDSRNIIYSAFEEFQQKEMVELNMLKEEAKSLGGDSSLRDDSLEGPRGTLLETINTQNERVRQGVRGLEILKRGDSVLLQEKGKDPEVTNLHFGHAISLAGTGKEEGGIEFSLDGMGCIFVPNAVFAGEEIIVNNKKYFTVTPAAPFGQQLLRNSLAKERKG